MKTTLKKLLALAALVGATAGYYYHTSKVAHQATNQQLRPVATPATLETLADSETVHIVFDLGNTLVKPRQFALALHMLEHDGVGLKTLIRYKDRIRTDWYATLEKLGGAQQPTATGIYLCDDTGVALPNIMVDWLDGTLTLTVDDIIAGIDQLAREGFYENKQHARLMKALAHTTFVRASQQFSVIQPMMRMVKKLARNTRVRMYVLSNWNDQAFDDFIASSTGKIIDRYIPASHRVVSGKVKLNKPHRDIFDYLLQTCNIPAHACIFIDDQAENIHAAREIGLYALDAKDVSSVRKTLQHLALL